MGLALMQVNETCAFSSAEKNNRNPAGAVKQMWMQNSLVSYHCNLSSKICLIQKYDLSQTLGDRTQEQHRAPRFVAVPSNFSFFIQGFFFFS